MSNRLAAVVLAALLFAGCGEPHRRLATGVAYGTDPAQQLDVWEPKSGPTGVRPVVIAIHGGGWQGGDKVWGESVAEELTGYGYVVVSINYRLAPTHRWPAQIEDCQAALNYVRAQAVTWNIDPDRVGAFGVSAGGHLASMLTLRPNPSGDAAACAVTANAEGDLTVYGQTPIMANETALLEAVLGLGFGANDLADISPTNWVVPGSNPVWVIHSTRDSNVYFDQGQRMYDALLSRGVETGFTVLRDGCHNKCWREPEALRAMRGFFGKHLGGKP